MQIQLSIFYYYIISDNLYVTEKLGLKAVVTVQDATKILIIQERKADHFSANTFVQWTVISLSQSASQF
jgi:hypothetical protein